ncbi:hypothetical protein ABH925_007595, partial [Streptacidiphilus sp. EB129]
TLLVNQINGTNPTPKELLHEPELVVRGTTAPRADAFSDLNLRDLRQKPA